jgi:hypothetical protein
MIFSRTGNCFGAAAVGASEKHYLFNTFFLLALQLGGRCEIRFHSTFFNGLPNIKKRYRNALLLMKIKGLFPPESVRILVLGFQM